MVVQKSLKYLWLRIRTSTSYLFHIDIKNPKLIIVDLKNVPQYGMGRKINKNLT